VALLALSAVKRMK